MLFLDRVTILSGFHTLVRQKFGKGSARELVPFSADYLQPVYPLVHAMEVVQHYLEAQAFFESQLHLERLPLPDETEAFIRVLTNPETGSVVYLIGTSHVSEASQDDVRMLIEAVGPDAVAVEVTFSGRAVLL